jgi:hypothetical protein
LYVLVPGMPVGVQVAVAEAGPGDEWEGGMPPEMAGMIPGGWMGPGGGDGGEENQDIVEDDMEIEE